MCASTQFSFSFWRRQKKAMAHPIHQANENSPYGDLTREEFYKKHQLIHEESFIKNQENMKIFTQIWSHVLTPQPRGVVGMIHGYTSESSWLFELSAVAIAKAGFLVCALDLRGHGYSDGSPGHIPKIQPVVCDCIEFFDTVRANHPKIPAFLFGESLGGAIAILICLKQRNAWDGLVLNGAMCGVSRKFKPVWPIEKLLPVAAFIAPKWRIVITKPPASKSYKVDWKERLVTKSPNYQANSKPPAATALEFLRVCECIRKNCHDLEVCLLVLHGGNDVVCDPKSAKFVYESAASKDKTLKIFEGMGHQLVGEPNESVELVFGLILSWLGDRADKCKTKRNVF